MDRPQRTAGYRPEIDGLRALAVLMVVLFHAGLGVPGGFIGVDVFFVISGFLITSHILRDQQARTFSLIAFYERRCRRIAPASVFVTLVVLAGAAYVMLPLDLEWAGHSAVAHAACFANVYFYQQSTQYFGGEAGTFPLLHMWSLAVEEQFYLLFPLLLILCAQLSGRSRSATIAMTAVLAAISFGASLWYARTAPMAAFFLLPSRAWELLVGSLLAMMPRRDVSRAAREGVSAVGLIVVVLPGVLYSSKTPFPGLAALPPCVGAAMLIWSCSARPDGESVARDSFRQTLLGRALSLRPLVFIGAISYSLYLWHWPALVLAEYWNVAPLGIAARIGIVALTIATATASWRWVELPFRTRRLAGSRWTIFTATALGAAAVAATGGWFQFKSGLPNRFAATVVELDATRREPIIPATLHNVNPMRDQLPAFGNMAGARDKDAPVDLLLWGDSHAAAALPAFDAICRERGLRGRVAIRSSTAPLLDYVVSPTVGLGDRSPIYNKAVLDYVARHRIRTVFLDAFWQRDIEHDPAKLAAAMKRTIAALRELGVRIYVMQQVPVYEQDVPVALALEQRRGRTIEGWRKSFEQHRRSQAVMYDLAERLSAADCTFIDPAAAFRQRGANELIVTVRNVQSAYHDDNHLSRRGAMLILGPMLDKVLRLIHAPLPTSNRHQD